MAKLGDLVVRVGANTRLLNQGLKQAKRDIKRTTGEIQNLGRSLSMGITAPLALIGASSVKVFADFEQSMAKVKAVSGATNAEFESLTNNAQELGRTTRFTASEVSALQLEFAKLGFTSEEITQVTGATLNLAQATGSDLAQSAEVAGATLRAFGLDASETGHVTDVMAAAFSSSALDINSFQDSMKFVAPVAKAAGVTLEEATAMLGQLANNGIKGSQAGTSLRRILQEVAGTGMDFGEAMKKSAGEVINLADAKDEVGRSASSAFLVLKEGMGDVDGLTTALQNSDGAAADMAATMDDTAEGAMKRMQSALEGAQIEIGQALAPIMIKLAGIVSDLAARFSSMSDGGQLVIMAASGIAAAIGPILYMLPNLAQGFKIAKTALKSFNATALLNPYVALGAAIVAATGYLVSWTREQNEARAAALEHRRELAKQAQAMRDAFGDTQTQSVDDLRNSISLVRSEIEKFSTAKIMENLTFDPAKMFGGIKLGKGAQVLNPETQNKLKQALKDQFMLLSAEALGLGLTGDEATAHIRKGMEKVVERTVASYRENLQTRQADLEKALAEALGETSTKVATLVQLYGGDSGLTREMFDAKNAAYELAQAMSGLGTQADELIDEDFDLGTAFFGQGGADLVLEEFEDIEEEIDDGTDAMIENFAKLKEAATNSMMRAAEVSNAFGMAFGGAVADVVSGEKTAAQALKGLALQAIRAVIQMAKANVIANATSPANAANLLSGGLATPAFIVAGLSMLEGFLGGITAFADGGIVSGPTLGLVGEYPGARTNPEVIAPLDKLRGMLGGQAVQVTGRLSGRDILLSSEYSAIDRNRVRGF